jgi:hypothetical protein
MGQSPLPRLAFLKSSNKGKYKRLFEIYQTSEKVDVSRFEAVGKAFDGKYQCAMLGHW